MTHGNDYYMYNNSIILIAKDQTGRIIQVDILQEFNDVSHEGYNQTYQSYWNVI